MKAYCIKDPQGKLDLAMLRETEQGPWEALYWKFYTHLSSSGLFFINEKKSEGYRLVEVTITEGE